MRSSVVAAAFAGVALLFAGSPALGQTPTERAEELYLQGKQLAGEQRYAEACSKFEESQRLEPAIGTQFNLADCLEHTQKPASALALFTEVARVARMSGKQDRQRSAEERIGKLEKTVPRLRITLASPPSAMTVMRDGEVVPVTALDKALPVDPGSYVISASAAGYVAFTKKADVGDAPGVIVEVTIPPLERVTSATPAPRLAPPPPPPERSTLAYVGLGAAAVGVIGITVGTVFAIDAIERKGDAGCSGVDCTGRGADAAGKLRDAQSSGDLATVFIIGGAVLAAGGAALWFFAPKVRLAASPTTAGLVYVTRW